jgi:hypothetical protein
MFKMPFRNEKLVDLIWSPCREDEFIAFGNDLYLFQTKNHKSPFGSLLFLL